MKRTALLSLLLLPLFFSGCVQPTRSSGFNSADKPAVTLPAGIPRRVTVILTGRADWAAQAAEQFSTGLPDLGFTVIERGRIDAILGEIALGANGFIDPVDIIKKGQLAGLDGVFIGSIAGEASRHWTDSHLSIRLVSTHTGETIWSVNAHDPRLIGVSMAVETSIIYTSRAALKELRNDIAKVWSKQTLP